MHKALLTLFLLAGFGASGAVLALEKLRGEAYALDEDRLLYYELHEYEYADGRPVSARVEYRLPDGKLIGQKTLDYRPSPYVPAFHTELLDGRYVEGLKHLDGELLVYQRKGENGKLKSRRISPTDAMAADAGFNNYVFKRFDELLQGEEVSFDFVAPGRLAAIGFDARQIGSSQLGTTPVVEFKVELSSFLSLFIDPLVLSYDPDTRQLIQYEGLSNVRDESGELYRVRIRYPQLMRNAAAPVQTRR